MIADSKSVGLRALVRAAGLDTKEITAGRVGFILAPRLNALGRIGRAIEGVHLLLGEQEDECNRLARRCEELNRERQELDRSILDEAMRRVGQMDLDATWGLVLHGEGWHPGVIGIVASRIVEQTGRPAMLIAVQDGIGKGSGRSIPAFDLHAALDECDGLLIRHGGHKAAAGLTIDAAQLDAFTEKFNAVARAALTPDDLVPVIKVDLALALDDANAELESLLRHVEPCGIGNPGPVFSAGGVEMVSGPHKIGTDGVKLMLRTSRGPLEAVGWGMAHRAAELVAARGKRMEIAFKLDRNEYKGASTLQAVLVDFRVEGLP
jgi:single-stranded-DNA-specific exonuclease